MKASVFVGTSVDGFIARPNHDLDFLPEGGAPPHDVRLRHVETTTYGSGLVKSEYEILR